MEQQKCVEPAVANANGELKHDLLASGIVATQNTKTPESQAKNDVAQSDAPSFDFTVAEATGQDRKTRRLFTATKVISPGGGRDYDNVYKWFFRPVSGYTLDKMAEGLRRVSTDSRTMIVRGALTEEVLANLGQSYRRLKNDATDDKATLIDVARSWWVLDIDGAIVPDTLGNGDQLEKAAYYVRDELLPEEFKGARMIACATSSTGWKGPTIARLRLFGLADRLISNDDFKRWADSVRNATDVPIDSSLYQPQQPIYTARPIFEGGLVDPVPKDQRVVVLGGDRDIVKIKLNRYAKEYKAAVKEIDAAQVRHGEDWRALLLATLGQNNSFYDPLIRALGVAARSDDSVKDICAFVASLMQEKADPDRRRKYAPKWVEAAVVGFRKHDKERDDYEDRLTTIGGKPFGEVTDPEHLKLLQEQGQFIDSLQEAVERGEEVPKVDPPKQNELSDIIDKMYGDVGLARKFTKLHADRFQYVAEDKQWVQWDGISWNQHLAEGSVFRALKKMIADIVADVLQAMQEAARMNMQVPPDKEAIYKQVNGYLADANKLKRVMSILPFEAGIETSVLNYDTDPMLLGVKNGVVDLRTGELLSPDPKLRIRKIAGCEYNKDAKAPRFLKFLEQVQNELETRLYLQRRTGYMLTGRVDEEKLFFDYGSGKNGKSVFLMCLYRMLGDYAVSSKPCLVQEIRGSESDQGREVFKMVGARLVSINELKQGAHWDAEQVKTLSSREVIPARKLYKESFDFMPTHKLAIRGNSLPAAKDTSDGFWRRLAPTKWGVKIEEKEVIPDLDTQLTRDELPGILAWAVEGCLEYKRKGLGIPPDMVKEANAYRKECDVLQQWLDECTTKNHPVWTTSKVVWGNYKTYCEEGGMSPITAISLGKWLVEKGYERKSGHGKTSFYIDITPPVTASSDDQEDRADQYLELRERA